MNIWTSWECLYLLAFGTGIPLVNYFLYIAFIQQIFIEKLLCLRQCVGHWGYGYKGRQKFLSSRSIYVAFNLNLLQSFDRSGFCPNILVRKLYDLQESIFTCACCSYTYDDTLLFVSSRRFSFPNVLIRFSQKLLFFMKNSYYSSQLIINLLGKSVIRQRLQV